MTDEKQESGPKLVSIGSHPSEADIANQYRAKARAYVELLCDLLNAAEREHNMRISFQISRDAYGRNTVSTLDVIKVL